MNHLHSHSISALINKLGLLLRLLLLSFVMLLITACPHDLLNFNDSDYSYKPVYLSYADLRQSVSMQPAQALTEVSRVYLYDNYVLLLRKNQGIHVLDNTDPGAPLNIAFIAIPGCTELSIRDGFLYADSYVDLITLDLNNPADIQVVDRESGVFPWAPYQNVDEDVYFSEEQLDENRGVITGYE